MCCSTCGGGEAATSALSTQAMASWQFIRSPCLMLLELFEQQLPGLEQAPAHGLGVDVQDRRDLVKREILLGPQQQHRSQRFGQPIYRLLDDHLTLLANHDCDRTRLSGANCFW